MAKYAIYALFLYHGVTMWFPKQKVCVQAFQANLYCPQYEGNRFPDAMVLIENKGSYIIRSLDDL